MEDSHLKNFYRTWLKANKPSVSTSSDERELESELPENSDANEEVVANENQKNDENEQNPNQEEPETLQFEAPEDIIFENNEVQLYIERGNGFFNNLIILCLN
jgi:hypothetical protein